MRGDITELPDTSASLEGDLDRAVRRADRRSMLRAASTGFGIGMGVSCTFIAGALLPIRWFPFAVIALLVLKRIADLTLSDD